MDTWILVADSSRARIFAASRRGKPWKLVEEFEHAETRQREAEINPKPRGKRKQSFGHGSPAMEPKTAPRRVEQQHFAQKLAGKLDAGLKHGDYGALVVVASPKFLGELKDALDKQVVKCITVAIDKDYTLAGERELVERLEEAVFGVAAR